MILKHQPFKTSLFKSLYSLQKQTKKFKVFECPQCKTLNHHTDVHTVMHFIDLD